MIGFEYDICILGGAGHIGLPLGLRFAERLGRVVLYDINQSALDLIRQGKMPFLEPGAEDVLQRVIGRSLMVSSSKQVISKSRYLVVVIGTPVDEHLNPKFSILLRFLDDIMDYLVDGQHIILRSTIYPGTTIKVASYLRDKQKHVKLSFCPERIAEGNAMHELLSLPQIVSSEDESSLKEAVELFSLLSSEIIEVQPIEAELAKLFCNSWRYIQFAVANQFYQVAHQYECDFYRIYHAVTHHYPRTSHFPRAGFAAGPCLLKDTMQLSAFSDNGFFLGHDAMIINEGLPNYLVQQLKRKHPLQNKSVGILGMAFKANSDDKRESLSYKLKKILEIEALRVLCSDVYIQDPGFVSTEELICSSDIIIIGAPHREYAMIVPDPSKVWVDVWDFFKKGGSF